MLRKCLIAVWLLFSVSNSFAQLVNIESQRMKLDKNTFKIKGNVNFNYSNINGSTLSQIGAAITTAFRIKDDTRSIYFFTGSYNLAKSKTEDFQNSWFFHLRYNRKLFNPDTKNYRDNFRLEAFLQNQNNELQTISSRNLLGLGIRWKFIDYNSDETKQSLNDSNSINDNQVKLKSFKAYFGNSYMYEIEKVQTANQEFRNSRNNSYVSLTANFTNMELINTIYFQPLYTDLTNFRIFEQLQLEIPFSRVFSFSIVFNYFYNSFSPSEVKDYNSNINFGLTFSN